MAQPENVDISTLVKPGEIWGTPIGAPGIDTLSPKQQKQYEQDLNQPIIQKAGGIGKVNVIGH